MRESFYIRFILTLAAAAIIYFGVVIVGALDRVRDGNRRIVERLDRLDARLSSVPPVPAPVSTPAPVPTKPEGIANADFFAHDAVFGGRLIQAVQADSGNMNSLINHEAYVATFNGLCNDSLAMRNFDRPEEFQPLLAESWEISPDHKIYRIHLRKGVFWQDFTDPVTGKKHRNVEVTAEDFKFMLDVLRNPEVNCEPLRVYYRDLDSVEIIGKYEFVVRWKTEYYGSRSATLDLMPLPRHFYCPDNAPFDGKKFNTDHRRNRMIVGCGAYQFLRWDKDQRVLFRRNPTYFGKKFGIAPPIEFLAFEIIKHPNTRFQSLLGGGIDDLSLTPDQWKNRTGGKAFTSGEIRKYQYLLPQYTYIGYNLRNPLFQDKRVRQALSMLVDREKILKDVYFGLGKIVTSPFFPESSYADSALRPWPFDPAHAKKLLAEAGWQDLDHDGILERNGKKFEFTMMQIASSSIQPRMMPLLKESFASAGIDMKIQNIEWSVYVQRLEEKKFDACCLGWSSSFDPDMYQIWHSSQADLPGSSNHISFRNAEADRLIEELRRTFDMKRRIDLAHQFARLLHEEQPYTFLFAPYSLEAISGRYRNVRVFRSGIPSSIFWVPRSEQRTVPGL